MTFESVVKDVYCFRDINDIMVLMVFMEGLWKLEKLEVSATLEVETITNILSGQILARLNHDTMGKKCESNPEILKSWEEILKCWKSQWDKKKSASEASFDLDWPQPIGSRASGVDTRWKICGNWNYVLKHLRKETWVNKNWTCRIFYLLQNSYIPTWKKHIFT